MRRRFWMKMAASVVIVTCLFAAGDLAAQSPSKGPDDQILPPLTPSVEEADSTASLSATDQPAGTGYSAGTVGEATFQMDMDTGSLIVLADEQTNEQIQKVLQSLDRPIPQVLIKVLFLEVTHSNNLDLGVEARYLAGSSPHAAQYTPYLTTTGPSGTNSINPPGMLAQNPTLIGPATPATDLMGNPMAPGELDLRDTLKTAFGLASKSQGGFYQILTKDLDATIYALATVGKMNVLSRPSILTRNNEQAYIQVGESVPYVTTTRYVTGQVEPINTVDYRDTGIILQVTPHITPEGLVEMVIDGNTGISATDWTRPIQVTADVFQYPITQRLVNTTVIVPDGMTVVLGGLMTDQLTNTVSKVPILGDIPWLGTAFRHTVTSKSKTELIMFLTPHVVEKSPSLKDLSAAETKHVELAQSAFTTSELDKHLDDWQTYLSRPKATAPGGFWKRTMGQIWSAISIFQ